MMNVAVLGYGTVGSGVVEVIEKNKEIIARKTGQELSVKYILDLRDFPGDPYENKVVHDYAQIVEDDEVAVICETMGGTKPAYDFTKQALMKGKSVCTSNKELVEKHGPELVRIAAEHNCSYMFEASVGGGIPIIRTLNNALAGERIEAIVGILNGTTNYILTKMEHEGADFAQVLKEAQEMGYAERNPEADVEGHDAGRKIAILSSLMTGKTVRLEKLYTEGISKITTDDFVYAKALDRTIKLLGVSKNVKAGTVVFTAPCMIGPENALFMVNDVFNAVCVRGNMLGDSMYYGRGAGKLPTASAVAADVIECAEHAGEHVNICWSEEEAEIVDIAETERAFFVRAKADAAESLQMAFPGGRLIEIQGRNDVGYVTPVMKEKDFATGYQSLGDKALNRIRVEG